MPSKHMNDEHFEEVAELLGAAGAGARGLLILLPCRCQFKSSHLTCALRVPSPESPSL